MIIKHHCSIETHVHHATWHSLATALSLTQNVGCHVLYHPVTHTPVLDKSQFPVSPKAGHNPYVGC